MKKIPIWKRKKIYLVLVAVLFLIPIILTLIPNIYLYDMPEQIAKRINIAFHFTIIEVSNKIFRVVDEFNIFRIDKDLSASPLPIYGLQLSANDIQHFDNISKISEEKGYLAPSLNEWRRSELVFEGKRYDVKVKLRGDLSNHWKDYLKSYKIKIIKDSINEIREFHLILFEDRFLTPKIMEEISNHLGLFNIENDIVILKINGVLQGLYYLQETLEEDFFEKNQCSNCVLIQSTDNWVLDHPRAEYPDLNGIVDAAGHGTDFDYEISNLDLKENPWNQKTLFAINDLFDSVDEKDVNKIGTFFDLDQISSFEVLRLLTGGSHFIRGDNLRMAYSLSTSKFYPIPRVEIISKLILDDGGIESYPNIKVPLFKIIARNEEIRHLRNKKVYAYVTNEDALDKIDQIIKYYLPYAISYKTNGGSNKFTKYRLRKDKAILVHNFEMIKRNLEYSKVYINFFEKNNQLKMIVIPDSIAQVKFDSLVFQLKEEYTGDILFIYKDANNNTQIKKKNILKSSTIDLTELIGGLYFSATLNDQMYPAKREYEFEILFNNAGNVLLEGFNINMSNDITGKDITIDDLYIQLADGNEYYKDSKSLSFKEFSDNHPKFQWEFNDGQLILKQGNYFLTEDLIIPKFLRFTIEKGTTISLSEGKSIVSYSPVTIAGTKNNWVVLKAITPEKPFGTFGIIGENKAGKEDKGSKEDKVDKEGEEEKPAEEKKAEKPKEGQEKTKIDWLDISGGSEKIINGIYFSGGLSIHNMDVEISNTKIHDHQADDGLNVKYGDIFVADTYFYNNFADQFDCDFCTGIIKNSELKDSVSGDDNGDGLDFSGSQIIAKGNTFKNFKDKGVSIGEKTEIILFNNDFTNNNLGTAVKDGSHAFFLYNTFKLNNVSISSYQKKYVFGGGAAYVFKNNYESNKKIYKNDKKSHNYKINFIDSDYRKVIKAVQNENVYAAFDGLEKYKADNEAS